MAAAPPSPAARRGEEGEEAARILSENRRLQDENQRLRAILAAVGAAGERCEQPQAIVGIGASAVPAAAADGGAADLAARLMQLMKEGGELQKERQDLQRQNAHLKSSLHGVLDAEGGALGVALGAPAPVDAAFGAAASGGGEGDGAGDLEKFLPLIQESEALEVERRKLNVERGELLGSLSTVCGGSPSQSLSSSDWASSWTALGGSSGEGSSAVLDREGFEAHLLGAVAEAREEARGLEAEVAELQKDNDRLRQQQLELEGPAAAPAASASVAAAATPAECVAAQPPAQPPKVRQVPRRTPPYLLKEEGGRTSIMPLSPGSRKSFQTFKDALRRPPPEGTTVASIEVPEVTEDDRQELQREQTARLLRRQAERAACSPKAAPLALRVSEKALARAEEEHKGEFAVKSTLTRLFRGRA